MITGRVRKFGHNIDTDTVAPGPYLQLPADEMKKYAFGPAVPDFYTTICDGDVIVAGNNFGCGSSREQATQVVKDLGISFVIADSIARIYYRNCIALGLHPIAVKGVSGLFNEGDIIEIDLESTKLRNPATGREILFEPLSESQEKIIEAGGILQLLKKIADEA